MSLTVAVTTLRTPLTKLRIAAPLVAGAFLLRPGGRILVVVETLPMFRLSLSVLPFSRLVFESPGFCGGGG